jgi:hypothetical protein
LTLQEVWRGRRSDAPPAKIASGYRCAAAACQSALTDAASLRSRERPALPAPSRGEDRRRSPFRRLARLNAQPKHRSCRKSKRGPPKALHRKSITAGASWYCSAGITVAVVCLAMAMASSRTGVMIGTVRRNAGGAAVGHARIGPSLFASEPACPCDDFSRPCTRAYP